MAPKSVIYYPFVGVADEPWIKNALLYWEHIYVIHPTGFRLKESHRDPEIIRFNKRLIDEGILCPIEVSSQSDLVARAGQRMAKLLDADQSARSAGVKPRAKATALTKIYREKLPSFDIPGMSALWAQADKKSYDQFHKANADGPAAIIDFPSRLAGMYMTFLAEEIAREKHLAMGTDTENREEALWRDLKKTPALTREDLKDSARLGFLVHLLMQCVNVEHNSVQSIVAFRKQYEDERRLFRQAIAKAFDEIPGVESMHELEEAFRERWTEDIQPKLNNLQEALRGQKVVSGLSLLKAAAFMSPPTMYGFSSHGALGAAMGAVMGFLPVVIEAVKANNDRENAMRANPMAYVLRMYDAQGHSTRHDRRLKLPFPK